MKYIKTYENIINDLATENLIEYLVDNIGQLRKIKKPPYGYRYVHESKDVDINYIKKLLKNGANPNAHDFDNNFGPILNMTCYFNNIELVKLLVDKCEVDINDTNGCGSTPIYISALNDFLESLQYLVEKGADINKPNFSNVYPLTAAVFYENWDCAIYLLKTGSDPNKFEPGNGKNYKFQKEFIMMYPDIFVKKFEKNRIHIKILREYEYIFSANKYNL